MMNGRDLFRKEVEERVERQKLAGEVGGKVPALGAKGEVYGVGSDSYTTMEEVKRRLTENERTLLLERLQGKPFLEIAKARGVEVATLQKLQGQALAKLRVQTLTEALPYVRE